MSIGKRWQRWQFQSMLKTLVKKTPILRNVARAILKLISKLGQEKFNSGSYWEDRYRAGGNSGPGSYRRLAEFKADIINTFVEQNGIKTVLELGCGDGEQLALANYAEYIGVDVSPTVLDRAKKRFSHDRTKNFVLIDQLKEMHADLSISLDVIYHLVEDDVFEIYMRDLFKSSNKFVIIYSSNHNFRSDAIHVRHRKFTDWIEQNAQDFHLIKTIKNRYPFDPANIDQTSFADFFIFSKNVK